ncbi:MAG TPA: hypothetical protein VM049_08165 [Gaiellaceae bacterium]|nr:hypothetical protein [Gaiellaceae bacterium]
MHVSIRTIAAAALVALLVPVAAVAKDAKGVKDAEIEGPTVLVGAGFFGGELELAMEEGQRPVRLAGRAGYIGILDLGGDLKVRCVGTGRVKKTETENGDVYFCAGRQGGHVVALGSHFKFRGYGFRYRALLPAGASGTFHGRFVACDQAAEESKCEGPKPDGTRSDPGRVKPADPRERGQQRPAPSDDEEVPTLAELAALLAGTK